MLIETHKEDSKGNVFRLRRNFTFTFGEMKITVPKGFESDGCSVPRFLWRLIFPPMDSKAIEAGVVHDYIYREKPEEWSRREADKAFLGLLIVSDVHIVRALLAYIGVRLFGWIPWKKNSIDKEEENA